MPLSIDLRKRVIDAVDSGMRVTDAAKTFKVCKRVIYNWISLRKVTGNLAAKAGYQNGHSHKITDWDQFKIFAESKKQCTIPQMMVAWKELTGESISQPVVSRSLKKINFTSKKKASTMLKPIKKNEMNF
jgi:transposase